jgi:hypothetical protein
MLPPHSEAPGGGGAHLSRISWERLDAVVGLVGSCPGSNRPPTRAEASLGSPVDRPRMSWLSGVRSGSRVLASLLIAA